MTNQKGLRLSKVSCEIFNLVVAKEAVATYIIGRRRRRRMDDTNGAVTAHAVFETFLPATVRSTGGFHLCLSKADLAAFIREWEKVPTASNPVTKEVHIKINDLECRAVLTIDFANALADLTYELCEQAKAAA